MPVNVTQGSCVEFTVTFFDANGIVTIPTSAQIALAYTSLAGSTASATLGLTPIGSFWTASWDTSVAALGFVNYSTTAPGAVTTPAAYGQIRLIQ
jgi:hypothetical protein